jgi:hypothetical protein
MLNSFSVAGIIPLHGFLPPNQFISHDIISESGNDREQQQYLLDVLRQKADKPKVSLRKRQDYSYDVYEGWRYVNALVRFF